MLSQSEASSVASNCNDQSFIMRLYLDDDSASGLLIRLLNNAGHDVEILRVICHDIGPGFNQVRHGLSTTLPKKFELSIMRCACAASESGKR